MRALNADYTKAYNRKLIFNLMRKGPVSRADMARQTGLTRAALTVITKEMMEQGLIIEPELHSKKTGRISIPLEINANSYYAVGVYLNRERCAVGLVNIKNECQFETDLDLSASRNAEEAMDCIADGIKQAVGKLPPDASHMLGVGISVPGPVNRTTGTILIPPDFNMWQYVEIGAGIEKRTGFRALIENDAYALADYCRESLLQNARDFLFLKVGPRVGTAIIKSGELYRGTNGLSGEIGHITLDYTGRRCSCGNYGCLELYASLPNLLNEFPGSFSDWKQVVQSGLSNRLAYELIRREADYLTAGIVSALNVIDFNMVVLAGEINEGFDLIAPMIAGGVNDRVINRAFQDFHIIPVLTDSTMDVPASANIMFSNYFSMY